MRNSRRKERSVRNSVHTIIDTTSMLQLFWPYPERERETVRTPCRCEWMNGKLVECITTNHARICIFAAQEERQGKRHTKTGAHSHTNTRAQLKRSVQTCSSLMLFLVSTWSWHNIYSIPSPVLLCYFGKGYLFLICCDMLSARTALCMHVSFSQGNLSVFLCEVYHLFVCLWIWYCHSFICNKHIMLCWWITVYNAHVC